MHKLSCFMGVGAALALSGCAALPTHLATVGAKMCDNAVILRTGYATALANAALIDNELVRRALVTAAQVGLAALETCPVEGMPST